MEVVTWMYSMFVPCFWSNLEYYLNMLLYEFITTTVAHIRVPRYYHLIPSLFNGATRGRFLEETKVESWNLLRYWTLIHICLFSFWDECVCLYLCLHNWCWFQLAGFDRPVSDSLGAGSSPRWNGLNGSRCLKALSVILLNGWHLHNNRQQLASQARSERPLNLNLTVIMTWTIPNLGQSNHIRPAPFQK